jgi:RNA polymerase sigma-70 factor (ECF subfamily)
MARTESNNWIDEIRSDANSALKRVYQNEREFCLAWMTKNTGLDQSEQLEIFQCAVIVLYDNIITEKITIATGKLSSYLISICKNKVRELSRKSSKITSDEHLPLLVDHINEDFDEDHIHTQRSSVVAEILRKMGSPCRNLLELFYYQKMNMIDICELMAYKNVDTVKNQKYKCLQRLRKEASYIYNKESI